ISLEKDISAVKARVENVDDYVFDLENVYLENTLNAIGRRAIIALIDYMQEETIRTGTQVFLTNFHDGFSEVLMDGTIGGTPIDNLIDPNIMTGKTYNNKLNEIKNKAQKAFNVDTAFNPITPNDIRVQQLSPWFVNVEMDVSFTVTTAEGTATWTRAVTIITDIAIDNLRDPYYLAKTSGSYENKIIQTHTKFNEWNVNKVKDHIRDGTYVHFQNSNAPNFLSRFVNDVTASSCCGIESLVNPNNPAISSKDVSYSDYRYWSDAANCANPTRSLFRVNVINAEFPNFKFDLDHLAKYKLTADAQICPPPQ
ncbi:MAG: hypothetical protein AABX63_04375, partial [Nanoarchaeota archaeon]